MTGPALVTTRKLCRPASCPKATSTRAETATTRSRSSILGARRCAVTGWTMIVVWGAGMWLGWGVQGVEGGHHDLGCIRQRVPRDGPHWIFQQFRKPIRHLDNRRTRGGAYRNRCWVDRCVLDSNLRRDREEGFRVAVLLLNRRSGSRRSVHRRWGHRWEQLRRPVGRRRP
ncbi:MAG: hypothetical protein ACI9VR_004092 [Cognaticolwellia sp.]|jgi:hypothetical protein